MSITFRGFIEWRLTNDTKLRLAEIGLLLDQLDEDSDEYEALKDTIRSLPGYPHAAPDDSDILLVVTDTVH